MGNFSIDELLDNIEKNDTSAEATGAAKSSTAPTAINTEQANTEQDRGYTPFVQPTTNLDGPRKPVVDEDAVKNIGKWIDAKSRAGWGKQQIEEAERKALRLKVAHDAILGLGDLTQGIANIAGTVGGAPNTKLTSLVAAKQAVDEAREERERKHQLAVADAQQKQRIADQNLLLKIEELKRNRAKDQADQEWREKNLQNSNEQKDKDRQNSNEQRRLDRETRKEIAEAQQEGANKRNAATIEAAAERQAQKAKDDAAKQGKAAIAITNNDGKFEVITFDKSRVNALKPLAQKIFERMKAQSDDSDFPATLDDYLKKKYGWTTDSATGTLNFIDTNLAQFPELNEEARLLTGTKAATNHTSPSLLQVNTTTESGNTHTIGGWRRK